MKTLIKVTVSLIVLVILASSLDWSAVFESMSRVSWWAIPVASLLQVCAFLVGMTRWRTLLSVHDITYRKMELVQPYFIGAFFNNFLPSSTGGDVYRIYHIHNERHGAAAAFSPVITERLLGLTTLLVISTVAFQFYGGSAPLIVQVAHAAAVFLLALAGFLIFVGVPALYRPAHRFLERWSDKKIIRTFLTIAETNHEYIKHPLLVARIMLISALMHAFVTSVFWTLGQSIDSSLPLGTYLLIVPLILVSSGLPITIGGLGVREATGIALLTSAGMMQPDAAVISILFIPTLLLASAPGLFFFFIRKKKKTNATR
ncbi:MAG: hypothetical protein DRR42_16490 [Gammaproteobacteria bacterium]|nr:MAG: hypothetical protein DRR42_16490 [Gammaproteobacteria bacterium]